MALIPLVDLNHLAALLGIAPWDPADADDLAVLAALLERREALAARRVGGLYSAELDYAAPAPRHSRHKRRSGGDPMKHKRLTWLRTECGTGKTCAGMARHSSLPGGAILQGYVITDSTVLDDLGPAPAGEGYLFVPDEILAET